MSGNCHCSFSDNVVNSKTSILEDAIFFCDFVTLILLFWEEKLRPMAWNLKVAVQIFKLCYSSR